MTTAADREGLREALASLLMAHDTHVVQERAEQRADAFINGFLADLLARADSAERMEAERDEARANYERSLTRCNHLMDRVVRLNAEAAEAEDRRARLSAEVEGLRAALVDAEARLSDGEPRADVTEYTMLVWKRIDALKVIRTALARTADKAEPEGVGHG